MSTRLCKYQSIHAHYMKMRDVQLYALFGDRLGAPIVLPGGSTPVWGRWQLRGWRSQDAVKKRHGHIAEMTVNISLSVVRGEASCDPCTS